MTKKTGKTAKKKARTPAPRAKARTPAPARPKPLTQAQIARLHGFARLKYLDPEALTRLSARAGKRAQKLHGKRVRWSARKAREMAPKGGKAIQTLWKTGKGPALPQRSAPAGKAARKGRKRPSRRLPGADRTPEAQETRETRETQAQPVPERETQAVPEPALEPASEPDQESGSGGLDGETDAGV